MCGQVGIIFGRKRRRPDERDYLRELFIRMLLHSEERGPHASGLAWLKTDGSHRIFKRPMRAHELVYEKTFQELLGQVDNETTVLMGHTRWRTRGNEFNNRNNHPIRAGIVIGTHNGTIYNADYLFRRLGLPRYAEVDSELIFRLADRFAPEGPIDQDGLKKALALCRGQMSAVLASRLDPGTITVFKGNKPLCLRIHRQHRVVLYASDDAFIDFAVDNETKPQDIGFGRAEGTPEGRAPGTGRVNGWRELEVPPMTMLTIRHEDVRSIENSEFRFIPQERKGTLPEGVNA
jgi:glucosamine 6-phosphate synthetase-like amidotransferase/phosphosugar isomerase protein